MLKSKYTLYIALFLSILVYAACGYIFVNNIPIQILLYLLNFSLFLFIFMYYDKNGIEFNELIVIALAPRLILLFAIPWLSPNFNRYLWDALLFTNGLNPYSGIPAEIVNNSALLENTLREPIFEALQSKMDFSAYPPLAQYLFSIPFNLIGNSLLSAIVIYRIILIATDLAIIYFAKKMFAKINLPLSKIILFALNPLVIVELTGNLHIDGLLILFLFMTVFFLMVDRNNLSAFVFALSASMKVISIVLFPLIVRMMPKEKRLRFSIILFISFTLLFLPFISLDIIQNYYSAVLAYFNRFEFNASIYYLLRGIGYLSISSGLVEMVRVVFPFLTIAMIISIAIVKYKHEWPAVFRLLVYAMFIMLLLSTTVYPWYIIPLIALSIFTPFRFAIGWSAYIFVMYFFYNHYPVNENLWIVAVEYSFVILFFLVEYFYYRKKRIESVL